MSGKHTWQSDSFSQRSEPDKLYMRCLLCGAVDGTPEADKPCPESPATLRDLAELRAELKKEIAAIKPATRPRGASPYNLEGKSGLRARPGAKP